MNDYHLELLSPANADSFYFLIQNNRSRLEDFFAGTVSKTLTLEATRQYCQEIEKKIDRKMYFPYLIIESSTRKLVGFIDVKNIEWSVPKGELGAFIDVDYEGKGIITHFGTELIRQIVAERGFKKLFCRAAPNNKRSIRVVQQIGFQLEGIIRCDYRTTNGELIDLNYYGQTFS